MAQTDIKPLLVSADPRCGKLILAKYLINHVLSESATACYFSFKDYQMSVYVTDSSDPDALVFAARVSFDSTEASRSVLPHVYIPQ